MLSAQQISCSNYFDVTINITWCLALSRTIFAPSGLLMRQFPTAEKDVKTKATNLEILPT